VLIITEILIAFLRTFVTVPRDTCAVD